MASETYQPSEAELEILNLIWELEPVTVRDIHARISKTREVGYTTVLKQIQRLTEKGVLEKQITGGTHYFTSTIREADVKGKLVDKMLNTAFGGSALDMMMHALGNDKVSPDELRAIKSWLDKQL
ncbi:MAG: BlaI/MecI/CopY family transcriptional regulator [Saprospiraceae bacterium]|nr:BlaI/MecI/CopY family transcriptional regulator [Lewinellaceae bacterium]